jgi:serine O-acetyltransferase
VWLTKSVEPHSTVVLEKPKLKIRAENAPETFDGVLDYQI